MADSCSYQDQKKAMSSEDFALLMKQGFEALMPTIRSSNSLPKDQQWDLFCTSPLFKPTMDTLGSKALDLMAIILQNQGLFRDIRRRDLEEKYELVVEANDKVLERVSCHLDELSGIRRNPTQNVSDVPVFQATNVSGSWNRDITSSAAWKEKRLRESNEKTVVLRNARITQRPQLKFLDKIDNSSHPFDPRIVEKPNALKPLAVLLETLPNEESCYSHPYEFELDRFQEKIDSMNLAPKKVQLPRPFFETPFLMVTQEDQLMDLLQDLKTQTEFAVDLEHHSYRSFQGFTCLMQISTREKDYVIDTLLLRHKLYVLNDVFTHPNIVKVFHGADSDIQWLQRDLCLYVVNMFDTYQASLLLSLPRLSLAYLLKTYCNVDANKHFQLYDWRTRPLSKEAVKYAREDTHYLLYIFDVLWNLLIEKSNGGTQMLESALYRSADTCKKRYWKFIFKEDSYEHLYRQSRKNFDNRQMYALKELFAWRDKIAREEDESTGYVLPNHMLLLIAEKLPKEMQGVLACCNPIPPLVRQNLVFLHQIILKAREQPLIVRVGLGINAETRARPAPQTSVNIEGALHCPHDMTHNLDFRDNLPTLLTDANIDINSNIDLLEKQPQVKIFGEKDEVECSSLLQMKFPNQTHFLSPFERYQKMLTYLESDENKSKQEKEKEVMEDTQKLLDECMKERLRQQASEIGKTDSFEFSNEGKNIKKEDEDLPNSRKRRSQDSEEYIIHENSKLTSSVKEETESDEVNIQCNDNSKQIYNKFISGLKNMSPQESKTDDSSTPHGEHPPKKKQKLKSQEVIPMNVGSNKKFVGKKVINDTTTNKRTSSGNFSQYDYSQVDYNQFHSQTQKSLTPKQSQDKFKQKGKKKQQNKSFTFARKY